MMVLGSMQLDVLRLVGFSRGYSWKYADQETIESLPIQQFVANAPQLVSLDVRIHPMLGTDGAALLQQLVAAGDAHEILALQTVRGDLLGYYTLRSVDEAPRWTLPDGRVLDSMYSVKLVQHRPPADAASPREAVRGPGLSPTLTTPTQVDSSGDPSEVPLSQVVRQ